MVVNPFTPTFGIIPPYLAGRNKIMQEMVRAFENGIGDPNLSGLFVGPRGCGKTALLSSIGREAMQHGWIAVNVAAGDGMLDDIIQQTYRVASEYVSSKSPKKLSGLSIGNIIGFNWDDDGSDKANWRTKITALLEELNKNNIGLLINVDEVRADAQEMLTLASTYQLLLTDGMKVALIMAGLPAQVDDLVSNEQISFLRRAKRRYLGLIPDFEIETAFRKTIDDAGKKIESDAMKLAVEASGGYAYMMQLVGYSIWNESGDRKKITVQDAEYGIHVANEDFREGVLRSTVRELSKGDIAFLKAMLKDGQESRLADISRRLNKKGGYASTYKSRLLRAGIIEETEGGLLRIAIPGLRGYLTE